MRNGGTCAALVPPSDYVDPNSERPLGLYRQALERLGFTVTQRPVDDSQYTNRVRARDYDGEGTPPAVRRRYWQWPSVKPPWLGALAP